MAGNKESERKFLLECIEVYRELPCLWKVTSPDYTNRLLKETAYTTLLAKFRERYDNATKEDVKKKINALRTNFRKEVNKVTQLEMSGTRYQSNMWYYDAMLFLKDKEVSEPFSGAMECYSDEPCEQRDLSEQVESADGLLQDTKPIPCSRLLCTVATKKRKRVNFRTKHAGAVSQGSKQRRRDDTDEAMSVVKAWGYELKNMAPDQQLFAKKAINDILFEGRLGTLHRHSVQINAPEQQ